MSKSLENLVHTRKYFRSSVTKIYNDRENFATLNDAERHQKLMKITSVQAELKEYDKNVLSKLYQGDKSESQIEEELVGCEGYQDVIHEVISLLSTRSFEADGDSDPNGGGGQSVRTLLRSPTAPLPTFTSIEGESLELFISNFEETLSKFKYSEYDKLLLLKQQVSGRAAYLIDSLEPNKQTYSEAKSLLASAFATTSIQKFNVIKQMCSMSLTQGDEPFKYMGEMRKVQQAVNHLKISMTDVMQYFFLKGMNDLFLTQLVHITNNIRPTLEEMNEHFFTANERYTIAMQNKRKVSKDGKESKDGRESIDGNKYVAMAGSVDYSPKLNPFKTCTLCYSRSKTSSDHPINKCKYYANASDKIKRLGQIKGCLKCANIDHEADRCKFRFRKSCNVCSKWHFSFLCPELEKGDCSDRHPRDKPNTHSNLAVLGAYPSSSNFFNILPTFVCNLVQGGKLRGMRDTGSQGNLVSERVLKFDNHEIIEDNLKIHVSGINDIKQYRSKLVRLKFHVGSEIKCIEAMTLPNISLSLNLPGLSTVANALASKGYKLADPLLLDKRDVIDDIDLILGADSAGFLSESPQYFGVDSGSVCLRSCIGLMLVGNIARLQSDLMHLPNEIEDHSYDGRSDNFLSSVSSINCNAVGISFLENEKFTPIKDQIDSEHEALNELLDNECTSCLNKINDLNDSDLSELNKKLVDYALNNCSRNDEGRIIMPLLWNGNVCSRLGVNYKLAKGVLNSSRAKLIKEQKLGMVNDAINEWRSLGVIEPIENFDQFAAENPSHSFLAHMPVFRMDSESTKCRVVFLSNLCDTDQSLNVISHNQAMHSGPCLNKKLSVALILLRFDKKVLCFDLKKAFLQIGLNEQDKNKLLFLWYNNPEVGDFTMKVFRNVRLSFGLRCSPTLLMLALYKILVLDASTDSQKLKDLKKLIYELIYMDNGAITTNSSSDLSWAYDQLEGIFNPYKYEMQQFSTNDDLLKSKLNITSDASETELFGLLWDTESDTLCSKKITLNESAITKRSVLKTVAEVFDPYNFNGPLLNRARIFLHKLQSNKDIGWDDEISLDYQREWANITKQFNNAERIAVPRCVGRRDGSFKIVAFVDSSKTIYGTVLYIIDEETGAVNFLLAKNRLIGSKLDGKSIPCLELLSIALGVETLIEIKEEISGPNCYNPIKVTELIVYSDSMVALSWVSSYFVKLQKMNKHSVFVMNRLESMKRLCDNHPMTFQFVDGISNPADCITRPLSSKLLSQSNYLTGPEFLVKNSTIVKEELFKFSVPVDSGCFKEVNNATLFSVVHSETSSDLGQLVDINRFSSLDKVIGSLAKVLTFVDKLKLKLGKVNALLGDSDYKKLAFKTLLKFDQVNHYGEVFTYFSTNKTALKYMPNIVKQMNIFVDTEGLLRVGSKMLKRKRSYDNVLCPLLLNKKSHLTDLIILAVHHNLKHSGLYCCLSELRKSYWIPCHYSTVKRVLKSCIHCRRFNQRTIKLNQNSYRDFRIEPINIPFKSVFVDYMGPFQVKTNETKVKVYVLCITCLWSRAINLKVSRDLSTIEFIRSFQLHSFEYGMPELVLSDLGTQLVAGANLISDILQNPESVAYFNDNNASLTKFDQYYKGHNELGSMVEICVKMSKRLIYASVGHNVLDVRDFEFMICEVVNVVNKRPVGFKDSLRDSSINVPSIISPEILLHGYSLLNTNIDPGLQVTQSDLDWIPPGDTKPGTLVKESYRKLAKVRRNLYKKYNEEFLCKLIDQAIDEKSRYKIVKHHPLLVGDVVLVKEDMMKPANYPMCRVQKLQINDLGETTGAVLMKGTTRELIKRHSSRIIPLLRPRDIMENQVGKDSNLDVVRPRRKAAERCEVKNRQLFNDY